MNLKTRVEVLEAQLRATERLVEARTRELTQERRCYRLLGRDFAYAEELQASRVGQMALAMWRLSNLEAPAGRPSAAQVAQVLAFGWGPNWPRIPAIKAIREISGCYLKEAKDAWDQARPCGRAPDEPSEESY